MCLARFISLLTSLDDQINTKEMGKTELEASCAYSTLDILSQRLVLQWHYNDTLPDLATKTILAGFILT